MSRKRLLAVVVAGSIAITTACGIGAGATPTGAALLVTQGFGVQTLLQSPAPKVSGADTVMRLLERNARVTTRYGGGFVESIDGRSARRTVSPTIGSSTSTVSSRGRAPPPRRSTMGITSGGIATSGPAPRTSRRLSAPSLSPSSTATAGSAIPFASSARSRTRKPAPTSSARSAPSRSSSGSAASTAPRTTSRCA